MWLVWTIYFIFDLIGRRDPPPITHPGFCYGFAGVALGLFFVIAFFKTPATGGS